MNGRLNWTLAQALAWILKQEHGLQIEHDETMSIAFMLMDEEDSTCAAAASARHELVGHLSNGRISASAYRIDNGDHVILPARYWRRLELCPDIDGDKLYERIKPHSTQGAGTLVAAYRDIRIVPQDVMRFWPAPPPKGTKRLTIVPSVSQTAPGPFHGEDDLPPVVIRTFAAHSGEQDQFECEPVAEAEPAQGAVKPTSQKHSRMKRPAVREKIKQAHRFAVNNRLKPWTKGEAETELPIAFPGLVSREDVRKEFKHSDISALFPNQRGRPRNSKTNPVRINELEDIRRVFCSAD